MLLIALAALLDSLAASAAPGPARQAELTNMLREDCGACHGITLKGGIGPAITPAALNNKPRQLILDTILNGRPGTPMPPWKPFLTRDEAQWLVERLYKGDADER